MNFPFPVNPVYTQIALAYKNKSLIADQVLPRQPVDGRTFKYKVYNKAESFTVPDTTVGRKGAPNEVEFGATELSNFVLDYGLDDVVPVEDVKSAPPGYDPLGRATEGLTDLILLDREKRVANMVFNAANYPAANKVQLAAADQWSNFSNASSDPVEDILTYMESMLMRPNTLVLGSQVWFMLRRHPKIIGAVYPQGGNASVGGVAMQQAVKELFEIENLYVGEAFINTAKPGQTATMSRLWGKHAALLHLNPLASVQGNGVTFGATATWDTRVAGTIDEPKVGLRGATRVRVGESVRELITASDAGFFIQDAVA